MNKSIRVLLLKPDEAPKVIELPDKLDALQNAVGGNIEIVRCHAEGYENCRLIIDEEGKFKPYSTNLKASLLHGVFPYDCIVGPALLCGTDKLDDIASLPREIIGRLVKP